MKTMILNWLGIGDLIKTINEQKEKIRELEQASCFASEIISELENKIDELEGMKDDFYEFEQSIDPQEIDRRLDRAENEIDDLEDAVSDLQNKKKE
jgi:polyhydroxyalkanoate synthesis regulator phasin